MVFVISVVPMIFANAALNPLFVAVRVVFVVFVIHVVFVNSTRSQTMGLANGRFR